MTQKNISGYISNRNAYIRAPKDISKNIYSSTIHNSPMLSSVWINELCLISFIWTYLFLLCFTLLCFTDITFFFYELKVCGNPVLSKSIGTIFPTTFAHFMSLCHILVFLAIFQAFPLLLYLSWWSVISDLWCYYYKKISEGSDDG